MSELSKSCGRTANRLFFGSFFSTEKKEHVPLVPQILVTLLLVLRLNELLVVVVAAGEVGALEDAGGYAALHEFFDSDGGYAPHDIVGGYAGGGGEAGFEAFYLDHGFGGGGAVV